MTTSNTTANNSLSTLNIAAKATPEAIKNVTEKQAPKATLNKTAEKFIASMSTFADVRSEKASELASKLNDKSVKRDTNAVKTQETHATYNAKLAGMTSAASNLVFKYKIDATAIESQSRELKKRTIGILEAIASNDASKLDNSLNAFGHYLISKGLKNVSTSDFQREAMHSTGTQSTYCKNAFLFLGLIKTAPKVATGKWIFDFNADSELLEAFLKLFK